MYPTNKLIFFRDMVSCSYSFYFWTYDRNMCLLESNCPEELLYETIFSVDCFHELIRSHLSIADKPVLLSNTLGLMWAVVFERDDAKPSLIHVMGPSFITNFSYSRIERKLNRYNLSVAAKHSLLNQLRVLPVIETNRLLQYTLMFHFCINSEKITHAELTFLTPENDKYLTTQTFEDGQDPALPATSDAEQELLYALGQGNLDYANQTSNAALAAGIKIENIHTFQRFKYPCYRFISLCCKTACDSGLSRYISYTLSNQYCEAIDLCTTPGEIKKTMDSMYSDYVHRVHQCRQNEQISKPLQTCCDFIRQNPTCDLTIDSLAAMVGYAPYYLSKKFKKELGTTLGQFIKRERIEYAKILLSSSQNSISQIGQQLHFCSNSHFSDTFLAQTGMLPREYRKKYQRI